MMPRTHDLLVALLWRTPYSHEKAAPEERRIYELETGILKCCAGIELLQNAFGEEELDASRKEIFKHIRGWRSKRNGDMTPPEA
jgi:hypothetical protein